MIFFVFFKQNTAYEMRISDWSSDVCSSDLLALRQGFLVTAILGNPDIVHSGQAFVLAGGSENDLRRATPLLNLIAQRIFHVADDAGMASLMKVACNALTGITLQSMGETLALLSKAGIEIGRASCRERVCQYV